jgi:hypothetical protein
VNRRVVFALAACAVVIAAAVLLISLFRAEPRRRALETTTAATPTTEPAAPAREPERAPAPRTPRAPRPSAESAPAITAPEPAPEAAPEAGTLRIVSDVPGAQVFIDRQFIGAAPSTAENVKPGSHQLNVSAEGFDSVVQSIDVEPGPREISVRFREVRLNSGIDVVHKHRIGSCRGRLVATAQGLRYETSDKNDAFTASLLDLDTFQVDYLEKNLRVRVKGKQYDFTDPDGNADRLFVFHRDVDKARDRLKKGDAPATN